MKGFLLAAGFGTRLWPLSDVRPKPAFPFFGRSLLAHSGDCLWNHGVRNFVINTHHLPGSIRKASQELSATHPGARIELIHEPEILGTSGALVNARHLLDDDIVIVMNAKIVTDIDLSSALEQHRRSGACVSMVYIPNKAREKFNHVQFSQEGWLEGIVPHEKLSSVAQPYIFTGIQILSRKFFDFLPPPGFSDTVKDVYPRILAAGEHVHVAAVDQAWSEFSTLARYRDLHLVSDPRGYVDPSATLAASARVRRSVVWENAEIGADCQLDGCIVADGVRVPSGSRFENVAIIQNGRAQNPERGSLHGDLLICPIT